MASSDKNEQSLPGYSIVMMVLSAIALGFRFWARYLLPDNRSKADDWFALATLVSVHREPSSQPALSMIALDNSARGSCHRLNTTRARSPRVRGPPSRHHQTSQSSPCGSPGVHLWDMPAEVLGSSLLQACLPSRTREFQNLPVGWVHRECCVYGGIRDCNCHTLRSDIQRMESHRVRTLPFSIFDLSRACHPERTP